MPSSSCLAMAALFATALFPEAVSMAIAFVLATGIFAILVSVAVSVALQISRALYNHFTLALQISRALYNYFTHTVVDTSTSTIKILSYNVLFKKENDMLQARMEALGGLIVCHCPDVICFQEVTLEIYGIFEKSIWWNFYNCSVLYETVKSKQFFCMQLTRRNLPVNSISFTPFVNFGTQKKISMVEIEVCQGKSLVIATSHLKSPTGNQMFSEKRVEQAKTALNLLKSYPNVIFGGDMNWNEVVDGWFPLSDGWVDAWTELRPPWERGWTYDTKSNPMLRSRINGTLQKRLDRFICNLHDFKLKEIDIIGTEAIPELPCVLPSDHYGLLLEIQTKLPSRKSQ
ncbi:hypothetical protein ACSBR2_016136 [Camellia fascicularis]